MREIARSVEEIRERHACTLRVVAPDALQQPAGGTPYEAVSVEHPVAGLETLTTAIPEIRKNYELAEIYVRPSGNGSVFEPLDEKHFAADGEWVVVARRRDPNIVAPRIVGIMMAKDEADVIPEVIAGLSKSLDCLYYSAGDEATAKAIRAAAPAEGAVASMFSWATSFDLSAHPRTDGQRHYLLEQARKDALMEHDPRPMWVMVVQGDEIYADDLRHHILLAQRERATVMTCQVATFMLHESQREGWNWTQPLEKRLTHYVWDFREHAGFLDFPWVSYNPTEHMRAHPHGNFPAKWASAQPVRKHYPFRTPEQARARIADRLAKTAGQPHGWQPHYENYKDVFVGDKAADREVLKYFGWFPLAERIEGIW